MIETAWNKGAKFDAWQDQFNYNVWMDAFDAHHLSVDFYTTRPRSLEEVFPWDHINPGVSHRYLESEYKKSLNGDLTEDCRSNCYACGILPEFNTLRRQNPGNLWLCPELK